MCYLDLGIFSYWYAHFHQYIELPNLFFYIPTDMICMHCVHVIQQATWFIQGRWSFQLVPNQVCKDDYNKQTVCFTYFLYCKYFTVSGILAICWKDIHIQIYTVFYIHTDFQSSIETHSYTCDDSNLVFKKLFTSTSDPTPRTWSASWLNLRMKQEIWWMGCLLGLGDMCNFLWYDGGILNPKIRVNRLETSPVT